MGTPDLRDRPTDPTGEDHTGEDRPPGRGRVDRRMAVPLIAVLILAAALAAILQSSGRNSPQLAAGVHSTRSASFQGNELTPPKQAPALSLRNYTGERVNISSYRGKAVLVTFLYTHCPDVCPLITANMRVAQNLMGAKTAAKTQVIAVSVDPRGDTPQTVAAFLRQHGMTGRMKYLIGSPRELGKVWEAWGVGSERDAQQPDVVNHSALVYGIDATGKMRTLYIGGTWKPSEIAHDVPLLASQ
ncbi:MAG: SCO family protein [Solirubrobacteraceae bacterium]